MATNLAVVVIASLRLPIDPENDDDDEDIAKLLEPLSRDHLVSLLRSTVASDPATLIVIPHLVDLDPSHWKIFVHDLNWSTSANTLQSFSQHGEIDDC